jgi:diacylglycerol kinase family enzyme
MRVLLLVNSTASSVTARTRVLIRKQLAEQHEVEVAETSRRGHATRLARAAANDGFDVVAVLAGDGTLNEAADGLAGTDTALAPLPGGSTNVYARTLSVPLDAMTATHTLLASLNRRAFTRIGLGRVNGRRFLFHTGLGFDAAVIRRVERYGELKRYASHPLHVVAAFETWFRHFDRSKPRFDITLENGERIEGVYFAIVSKTSPYTYLGPRPLVVTREAGLHSRLALTAFQSFGGSTLLRGAASALGSGKYLRRGPGIVQRHDLRELRVDGRGPFPYQVDGDDLGDVEDLDVDYEDDTLTLVLP